MSPLGGQYATLKAAEAREITAHMEAALHRARDAAPKGKKVAKMAREAKKKAKAAKKEKEAQKVRKTK